MNKMLAVTLFPLGVLTILAISYGAISARSKMTGKPDPRGATVIYIFLFFTFLILVQCSSTVFDFFQCKSFPEALNEFGESQEKKYLNRDYSVDCFSPRYNSFVPYGLMMIAVRSPLLYACTIHLYFAFIPFLFFFVRRYIPWAFRRFILLW
jgi:hypothetical protein